MGGDLHATVLMSGGIDSAACAAFLAAQGLRVSGIFVDHGQAAAKSEYVAVKSLASDLKIQVNRLTFSGARSFGAGQIVGRNAFLIFSALVAIGGNAGEIALGIHAGTPYYDCSPAFLEFINRAVAEYTDSNVQVVAPFIHWTKRDVYDYLMKAGLTVDSTYSCEQGTIPTCGKCASCLDRKALGC
jgi:7-cyano-7-deazaguanine synthase